MSRFIGYVKGHRRRTLYTAVAALLACGAGVGVGAVTANTPSPAASAAVASPSPSAPAASASARVRTRHPVRVRGKLTAVSGNDWTLETPSGATVTVVVTPATHVGRRAVAGAEVVVVGQRSGSTITAARIRLARGGKRAGASST